MIDLECKTCDHFGLQEMTKFDQLLKQIPWYIKVRVKVRMFIESIFKKEIK